MRLLLLCLCPWLAVAGPPPNILFILADDPGEQQNLAAQQPELARQLRERLESELQAAGARRAKPVAR
jgi:hypothetical protein